MRKKAGRCDLSRRWTVDGDPVSAFENRDRKRSVFCGNDKKRLQGGTADQRVSKKAGFITQLMLLRALRVNGLGHRSQRNRVIMALSKSRHPHPQEQDQDAGDSQSDIPSEISHNSFNVIVITPKKTGAPDSRRKPLNLLGSWLAAYWLPSFFCSMLICWEADWPPKERTIVSSILRSFPWAMSPEGMPGSLPIWTVMFAGVTTR